MPRALTLVQNSFAIIALVAIISLSMVTTLGLSPMAADSYGKVAGLTTQDPKILSNFIPVDVADANDPSSEYTSQLVQLTQSQYHYTASLTGQDKGVLNYDLVTVRNQNTAPIRLRLSARVAREVSDSLNINVENGDAYRVHAPEGQEGRVVEFIIPAHTTALLHVEYELLRPISFPFQVSFDLEY